jgi:glycerate kinase
MRVLIAPDKFKGSLSATAVADNLAKGFVEAGVETATLPLADGGDGSVAAALAAGFQPHACTVADALGRPRPTTIAVRGSTAVIELASSCGLSTLPSGVLAPMTASSYGFGEAIRYAIGLGARRLVLALGGSASTDGGTGILSALGYHFCDISGNDLSPTAQNLNRTRRVRCGDAVDLRGIELIAASDVTSTLLGPSGAAAIFGPQKGASLAQIDRLEAGLKTLVAAMQRSGWSDADACALAPGAGAAGGCGFAAMMLGAQIVSGADYFLDLLGFDQRLRDVDLVVTGEGRLDNQTLAGKLPVAVARRASPIPVIAVVGRNDLGDQATPFREVFAVADRSDTDTAGDGRRTAILLREIGTHVGYRLQGCSPKP